VQLRSVYTLCSRVLCQSLVMQYACQRLRQEAYPAYRKVVDGTLGLGAIERRGRHADLTKGIALNKVS
jgi:hypothetical protein